MSDPKERRYYPRTKVKLPVVKMVGNDLVDGEIEDLSLGGAFIRCSAMPNGEDNFHMVITQVSHPFRGSKALTALQIAPM